MDANLLAWKRFWCPRGGSYSLTPDGYLQDYSEGFYSRDTGIVSLHAIHELPCLILLGEPGMGKSTELIHQINLARADARNTGDAVLDLNLGDFQTDQRLFDKLINGEVVQRWAQGNNRLFLFLDSLDEALININVLATALPKELAQLPIDRLYLRITSRTQDWPSLLEEEFQALWGKENVFSYELLPLRKHDVEIYIQSRGLDTGGFLQNVETKEGQAFAIRPVTLSFLTDIFREKGVFPESKTQLYLEGIRLLCTETNKSRMASRRTGRFTPKQKMKVAGRIAALTMFTNMSGIQRSAPNRQDVEGLLGTDAILGGEEMADGDTFAVDPDAITETLNTGLYSSHGSDVVGWAHRTYAEFLAAWYISEHDLDHSKVSALITHPEDLGRRLIPQLHETSAWMAMFSREIFDDLIRTDPQVLLKSDVVSVNAGIRESLVQALLTKIEQEQILRPGWGEISLYRKLNHPGLGAQLRSYVCDKSRKQETRRIAIDIAEICDIQVLSDDLADIALDPMEALSLRESAAHAVMRFGNQGARSRLLPLAHGSIGEDPHDELKACALYGNWPENLSTEKLFALLTPPKDENFLGLYEMFISSELIKRLGTEEIPIALAWIARLPEEFGPDNPFLNLIDQIMWIAWNNLFSPAVLESFSIAALRRIQNYSRLVSRSTSLAFPRDLNPTELIRKDDERRHALVLNILQKYHSHLADPFVFLYGPTPLVLPQDFDWLTDVYFRMSDNEAKDAIAKWLPRIWDAANARQTEVLYGFYESDPRFEVILKSWFGPIELDSEIAIMQKRYFEAMQQSQEQPIKVIPPPAERISYWLIRGESGDPSAWWNLNLEMTLDETSTHYGNDLEQDLTRLPGWQSADSKTRDRLMTSAKRYLVDGEPSNNQWLGKGFYLRPALAGYRALRLIMEIEPQFVYHLDSSIWDKWAMIILEYPFRGSERIAALDDELIKLAYRHAALTIKKSINKIIQLTNRNDGSVDMLLRRLEPIWDSDVEELLLRKLRSKALKASIYISLMESLVKHDSKSSIRYLLNTIERHHPSKDEDQIRRISASIQFLLLAGGDPHWDVIWNKLINDLDLAEDVIGGLAYRRASEGLFSRLSFDQLERLFEFLMEKYPPSEDPNVEGMHEVGPREKIAEWRDSIPIYLERSGTPVACQALRKFTDEFPSYRRLRIHLIEGETNMRMKTWRPLRESELLELFRRKDAALVESGYDLLAIVLNALQKLDSLLQGETPAAVYLWNEMENRRFRPKDENQLSDYIKIHLEKELKERGVVINREVEIRHGDPYIPGQRTDLHIDAVKKLSTGGVHDVITLVVEVKGCWHRELKTAMKTQLADRYMSHNAYKFGIYLIGWFVCPQWDSSDPRLGLSPSEFSIEDARRYFEEQAKALSSDDGLVRAYVLDARL